MNGKPILVRDNAKTVLTFNSAAFQEKALCDGITLNLGDACAFSCRYCYVGSLMRKVDYKTINDYNAAEKLQGSQKRNFESVVIRRKDALKVLETQLFWQDGSPRHLEPMDRRMVYSSTLVDVAGNLELLRETAEACNLILRHTNWQIRLLSKSAFLHLLFKVKMIPMKYRDRLVLGVSTGTLDDRVAAAIEVGTAHVSARLKSLRWLQEHGYRTFAMICPSLPQEDYRAFSANMCDRLNLQKCEHVWAEVINIRGASFEHTHAALLEAKLFEDAERLAGVSGAGKQAAWENYAQQTFLAHAENISPAKLRFLQYVSSDSSAWWFTQKPLGAIPLGSAALKYGHGKP